MGLRTFEKKKKTLIFSGFLELGLVKGQGKYKGLIKYQGSI